MRILVKWFLLGAVSGPEKTGTAFRSDNCQQHRKSEAKADQKQLWYGEVGYECFDQHPDKQKADNLQHVQADAAKRQVKLTGGCHYDSGESTGYVASIMPPPRTSSP